MVRAASLPGLRQERAQREERAAEHERHGGDQVDPRQTAGGDRLGRRGAGDCAGRVAELDQPPPSCSA